MRARLRPDLVVFALLVAGSAWVVWSQAFEDPVAPYEARASAVPPVGSRMADALVGEVLPPAVGSGSTAIGSVLRDATLLDISDQPRRVLGMLGEKATVLYFWSIECPCTEAVEMRMKMLMERYEGQGVEFVAVDGHPDDKKADVVLKMARLHAPYRMLLDPGMEIVRAAGVGAATDAVVLDPEGRIRYRGAIDDALVKPTVPHLRNAIDAVLAGRDPSPAETKSYGCPYPGYAGECSVTGNRPALATLLGPKATVLYFWSVECPCTVAVEKRVQEAMAKYEPQGVVFLGVDGHPEDAKADVVEKMASIGSRYRMILDPMMDIVRKAGVLAATDVVVLDGAGRIRYRGAVDDDLVKPTTPHLHGALDAVLAGRDPSPEETRSYGCPFPGREGECTFR